MGSGFRDTGRFSRLPYLGMKLGHQKKVQKLHIFSLSTPGGRNLAYFRSTGSDFRDTGRFSKLPYLGTKLGCWKVPEVLHIHFFSTPGCQTEEVFSSIDSGFRDMDRFLRFAIFGQQWHIYRILVLSFYRRLSKSSLFSLYGL